MTILNFSQNFLSNFKSIRLSVQYLTFQGYPEARKAVADYSSNEFIKVDSKVSLKAFHKNFLIFDLRINYLFLRSIRFLWNSELS